MEALLGQDLMNRLKGEHEREIQALWEEQLMLREELERIVTLMQTEIVPREQQMHAMINQMQQAWQQATHTLHAKIAERGSQAGLTGDQRNQVTALQDPLADMERELDRIGAFLSHEVVKPNIASWEDSRQQQLRPQVQSPISPSRAQFTQSPYQQIPSNQRSAMPGQRQPGSPSGGTPYDSGYVARRQEDNAYGGGYVARQPASLQPITSRGGGGVPPANYGGGGYARLTGQSDNSAGLSPSTFRGAGTAVGGISPGSASGTGGASPYGARTGFGSVTPRGAGTTGSMGRPRSPMGRVF